MRIAYSGRSKPSALKIQEESNGEIEAVRSSEASVNWGRANANTKLNPDTSNATNKRVMRELFKEHGVPMPELVSWSDVSSDLSRGYPRKVVGRPDYHMKGRGFWVIDSVESMVKAMKGTRRKKPATHFMEYIDAPHELRIHIFLGKSIRVSEKAHTAFHEYTTIKPTVDVKQARKAAKQAVKALGLDFGTVDVLVKEDGTPYVLEVNTAPGLGGSMPKLWADTFKKWHNGEWEE